MKKIFGIILLLMIYFNLFPDTNFRVMSYNTLNFDGTDRLSYFQTVINNANPDILICQEIESEAGANAMLSVLNAAIGGYARSAFILDTDLNNMLYYKTSVGTLVSQDTIGTSPRDISEYVVNIDGNPIIFYSCHLKSSSGSANEADRLAAVTILRNHLNGLAEGTEFIIVGDMNFYTSSEEGYQKFIADETNNIGRAQDLCTEVGNWHNNGTYSSVHSQSTRETAFGGGAGGGLDDKFDFIFGNYGINNSSGIEYSSNSFTSYGNDGNHFNQSINNGTNSAVPDSVADALYYASDHLPVYADFVSLSGGQPSGYVFISEYIEGSSNNKAIEIYNGTGAAVDLSAYSLEKDVNGNEVWGNTYNYSGTLAHGEVFVLANSSATQAILDEADDTNGSLIVFNGDDQVRLLRYSVEIDRIGIPGDITFGQNVTYVRKSTVTEPQSGPQDPRSNGEWDEYSVDTFSYLGSHSAINPTITLTSPNGGNNWERGDSYNITWTSNDFTDNVKIELYKNSSSVYTELITSTENNGLWQWNIPPEQPIAIDYKIRISDAVDGIPNDESDSLFSISGIYRICEIQTTADSLEGPSPYLGENVKISGIVTAVTSNGYYLQDAAGAWNGIYIYDNTHFPGRGDSLIITGLVDEYYSLTELKDLTEYSLESLNNVLPDSILISTGNIAQEKYEGVFVYVINAECINDDLGYGEWLVNDSSGDVRIDDQMYMYSPFVGVSYNIAGVVNYSFSNFKIESRDTEDISLFTPDPPVNINIEIIASGDSIKISWNNEGYEYKIYSCDDPYGTFDTLETTVTNTGEVILLIPVEAKKFYRLTAE
jgi:endonuclease/exonuclease/phosphatase family metal-dependent hydrolase